MYMMLLKESMLSSLLLDFNETNIKVIQSVMGHADIKTTMEIYAEATDEKKQEVMQNLSAKWKNL